MQQVYDNCVVIKNGIRCTNDSSMPGCQLPILKPEARVFICVACIDEMQFVAHQKEPGIAQITGRVE